MTKVISLPPDLWPPARLARAQPGNGRSCRPGDRPSGIRGLCI